MAREASPATLFIRKLVSESKGTITFSNAKEALEKGGHGDVTQDQFNMTKYLFLKKRKDRKAAKKAATAGTDLPPPKHKKADPTPVKVEVSVVDALKFVADNGGLAKVKASLTERRAALERDEALAAAFESLTVQVKAAS